MGRKILGVIAGYISMAVVVFIFFTILYIILGTEGSFEPNSFQVSMVWIIASIILGFVAAVFGGYICTWIAKDKKAAMFLAGLVLVLGIIMALPKLSAPADQANKVRSAKLSNMEAMQQAEQPASILILNPILGAVGIFFGARLRKEKQAA